MNLGVFSGSDRIKAAIGEVEGVWSGEAGCVHAHGHGQDHPRDQLIGVDDSQEHSKVEELGGTNWSRPSICTSTLGQIRG